MRPCFFFRIISSRKPTPIIASMVTRVLTSKEDASLSGAVESVGIAVPFLRELVGQPAKQP